MSSEIKVEGKEDQTVIYEPQEEEDEEADEDEEDEDDEEDGDEEEEEDLNFASPTTSSDDPNKLPSTTQLQEPPPTVDHHHPVVSTQIEEKPQITPQQPTEDSKKPLVASASEESRKLFQRLWTDEDEIGLLQGYLDFTIQRGNQNSSYHHDTGLFYDQIKTRLQLDFNKNQLVEKLRRLKKKYRNVMARIGAGKDVSFKSLHDQATFEIARKIWGGDNGGVSGGVGVLLQEDGGVDEEEGNVGNVSNVDVKANVGNKEKKPLFGALTATPTARRSQKRAAESELSNLPKFRVAPSAIEETVRSCLSPLFKELINCAMNGGSNLGGGGGGLGGVALNPMALSFGGNNLVGSLLPGGDNKLDERWRKQQILELEVYSKRIELVQEQIKSSLEDLRSMDDRR